MSQFVIFTLDPSVLRHLLKVTINYVTMKTRGDNRRTFFVYVSHYLNHVMSKETEN